MSLINQPLRALSWKNPFAELMLHGKIETRTWYTKYRGLVLICASKQMYNENQLFDICGPYQFGRIEKQIDMDKAREDLGMAIAIGELVDVRNMLPEDADECFVKFDSGLKLHVYKNIRPIKAFPWKGSQGWKEVSEDIKSTIEFL